MSLAHISMVARYCCDVYYRISLLLGCPPPYHSPIAYASVSKHPLFYTRLNDAGTSFEPERNVITYAYGLDGGSSVAADSEGNVYAVWHAPQPGGASGEAGRAVFIARSRDQGETFDREAMALPEPTTGACGCCGLRAFASQMGAVYILYRAASPSGSRAETLLVSRAHGSDF